MSNVYDGYGEIELRSQPRLFAYVCPMCKNWQMEYTEEVYISVARFRPGPTGLEPDLTECAEMVDSVLEDHLREEHPLAYKRWKKTGRL